MRSKSARFVSIEISTLRIGKQRRALVLGPERPCPGVLGVCGTRMDGRIGPRRRPAIIGSQSGIKIDVFGLPEERIRLISARIGQRPTVLNAHWHPV